MNTCQPPSDEHFGDYYDGERALAQRVAVREDHGDYGDVLVLDLPDGQNVVLWPCDAVRTLPDQSNYDTDDRVRRQHQRALGPAGPGRLRDGGAGLPEPRHSFASTLKVAASDHGGHSWRGIRGRSDLGGVADACGRSGGFHQCAC